jgi:hypothetical protein
LPVQITVNFISMPASARPLFDILAAHLAPLGLALRGGFALGDEDALPDIEPGRPARSLILIGNIGGAMWPAFQRKPHADSDPLDAWTRQVIDAVAEKVGARPLYPFDGPPYYPFQRWAERAEGVKPSPLMIFIHPQFGLWHAYRAALLFAEDYAFPSRRPGAHPCESCADKPCLSACPVGAFSGSAFDDRACATHVDGPRGTECRDHGCLARRACPIGRAYAYPDAQMAFHMEAFLAPRRSR